MIFLKIAGLFGLVYLIARGFTITDAGKVNKCEAEIERLRASAVEAYDLMQGEKEMLVATINELRDMLQKEKQEKQEILKEYWRNK